MKELNVALCGVGRWGKNHLKTALSLLPPEQISVYDPSPKASELIKGISERVKIYPSFDSLLKETSIDAVIISTPAETHFTVAKQCLEAGKHVLVEKPLTLLTEDTHQLIKIADERNLKLMVGHVMLYHNAIHVIKKGIDSGRIGKLQYLYSNRLNLGMVRSEENILWSFAPHDISIIQFLTNSFPEEVEAKGSDFLQNGIEDVTMTYLRYPGNIAAHIFVSWLHPFKEQRLVVVGDEGMYVFEDTLKDEKLKFYKKGFTVKNGMLEKFDSEYEIVPFEQVMPLTEEQKHFYHSILEDTTPLTDGKHASEVLKILEEATKRLKGNGE